MTTNRSAAIAGDPSSLAEVVELCRRSAIPYREKVGASRLTTMATGGPIELLIEPDSVEQVAALVLGLQQLGQSYRVLGGGSNLLIPDAGIGDPVVRLGRGLRSYTRDSAGRCVAGGAMPLMTLSRETAELGLAGLEFAGGIPATVGGAVRMNAGAHGGEIASRLEQTTIVTAEGRIETRSATDLDFSYRHSNLDPGAVVVQAVLKLTPSDRDRVTELRQQFLTERKKHQPLSLPSAGSIFKNPAADRRAGVLIEECGLRGIWHGGSQISEMHGNWIVNPAREGTTADVLALIDLCVRRVGERFGVMLEREVRDL